MNLICDYCGSPYSTDTCVCHDIENKKTHEDDEDRYNGYDFLLF